MKLFNNIWEFFSSVKLAIFTLCSLAVTSIGGTVIPQTEPFSFYVQRYGEKVALFIRILDLDRMYSAWWFTGLLLLLALNLIVCSFDRFPATWKRIHQDNLHVSLNKLQRMRLYRKWTGTAETVATFDPHTVLGRGHWQPVHMDQQDAQLFFNERGKWSRLGVYLVHSSIIIIFVGAFIGSVYGEKGSIMLPENQSTDRIFRATDSASIPLGFEVRCDSFTIDFYPNGMPKEYTSRLTILDQGQEIVSKSIEVNDPLTHKGFTFYQSSYKGFRDFLLTVENMESGQVKTFQLPFQKQMDWQEQNIHFGILNAKAMGERVTQEKLWIKAGDQQAVINWLDDNVPTRLTVGGQEYRVTVKQLYATGLQVAKDPGVWVVYLGCAFMLIGLYMAFFLSHTRLWIVKESTEGGHILHVAGSTNKNKGAFANTFLQLTQEIDTFFKS